MAGVAVSKANLYASLSPPLGVSVSKANLYASLSPPPGVSVSKVNLYAVVGPPLAPIWPIGVQVIFRGVKRSATDGTPSEPLQEIQQAPHVKTAV
jgi:hypothetical protein